MTLKKRLLAVTEDTYFHSKALIQQRDFANISSVFNLVSFFVQTLIQFVPGVGQFLSAGLAVASGIVNGTMALTKGNTVVGLVGLANAFAPYTRLHLNPLMLANAQSLQQLPRMLPVLFKWAGKAGLVSPEAMKRFDKVSLPYYNWLRRGRFVRGVAGDIAKGRLISSIDERGYPILHELLERRLKRLESIKELERQLAVAQRQMERSVKRLERAISLAQLELDRRNAILQGNKFAEIVERMQMESDKAEKEQGNDIEKIMRAIKADKSRATRQTKKDQADLDNRSAEDDLAGRHTSLGSIFIASITAQAHKVDAKSQPTSYVMTVSYVKRAKMLTYTYYNVSRADLFLFLSAPSKGRYWNDHYKRVRTSLEELLPSIKPKNSKLLYKELTPSGQRARDRRKTAYERKRRELNRTRTNYVPYDLHGMISSTFHGEGMRMTKEDFLIRYDAPVLKQRSRSERPRVNRHVQSIKRARKGKYRLRRAGFVKKR